MQCLQSTMSNKSNSHGSMDREASGSAQSHLQAGVFIDVAARFGCTNTTGALNQASCAATVTLIIAAIANVVSYLSGAAQRCGDTVQMGICGSDAGSIANAIAGIANGGASLLGTCQQIASRGWEKLQEFRQLEQPPVPGLKLGQQLSFV